MSDRASIISRIGALSTGLVSDAMDRLALPRGGAIEVLPISGQHLCGTAFTVLFGRAVPGLPFDEYIDRAAPGDVLVLANGGRADCSVWGGLRSLAAIHRGIAGTVVDGACRDVDEHEDYPVFARHRTMMGARGIVAPVQTSVVVPFAGVAIHPGDIVLGDSSGTIAIPAAFANRVADEAQRIAVSEEEMRAALQAGVPIDEARTRTGLLGTGRNPS
jgi:4-hydroxy-4-methyl-2-oxoglutarate aldolase